MTEIWVRARLTARRLRAAVSAGMIAAICINFAAGCTNDQKIVDKHRQALEQEEE